MEVAVVGGGGGLDLDIDNEVEPLVLTGLGEIDAVAARGLITLLAVGGLFVMRRLQRVGADVFGGFERNAGGFLCVIDLVLLKQQPLDERIAGAALGIVSLMQTQESFAKLLEPGVLGGFFQAVDVLTRAFGAQAFQQGAVGVA